MSALQHTLFGDPQDVEYEEPPEIWSDQGINELLDHLLTETIHSLLDGRCSKEEKWEAWCWLKSNSEHSTSFLTCCFQVGIDAELLKEKIIEQLLALDCIPEEPWESEIAPFALS